MTSIKISDYFVTVSEYAELTKRKKRAIQEDCKNGKLDAEKVSNLWLIRRDEQ